MVQESRQVEWIEADENRWGIRVLDIRPLLAQCMIATSSRIEEARNAMSYAADDGAAFVGREPVSLRLVDIGHEYPVERWCDGALFRPSAMEDRWAIFVVHGRLVFVRSWTREVMVIADVELGESSLRVTRAQGFFLRADESEEFTRHALDFLMKAYVLRLAYPAPLPETAAESNLEQLALETVSAFGTRALFGADAALSQRGGS